jgi:thiol:disulfide interchange protein DsbG
LNLTAIYPRVPNTESTRLMTVAATLLILALAGCSKQESAQPFATPASAVKSTSAQAALPTQPFDAVAAQGKGFTVGAMMSAQTVYVMFDPQCPHCGHLWEASLPLQKKIKFVWVPVAFMGPKSTPQGAALLSAANPAEAMTEHEKSILAGTGGMAAPSSVSPEMEATIKSNTALFNQLKVDSVPYVLAKNMKTGQMVTNTGAMTTPALAEFLGVDTP